MKSENPNSGPLAPHSTQPSLLEADVLIIGGGIAGLWTHFLLSQNGVKSLLLDSQPLGSGQTIASQGMIHGGQRYTLSGMWNQQADTISQMPKLWDKTIQEFFQPSDILSQHQYLWSEGTGLLSKATSFFASKAMQTKTQEIHSHELPPELQKDSHFSKAKIFKMPEKVIAVQSLLSSLLKKCPKNSVFLGELKQWDAQKNLAHLLVSESKTSQAQSITLKAKCILFTAGLSNEKAFEILEKNTGEFTQRRPLTQVLVKGVPFAFYGHAITVDPRPRATITAHPHLEGWVWYLGGLIANFASEHTEKEALKNAYSEMTKLFPSIPWKNFQWATHSVLRAEPKVKVGFMPDGPEISVFTEKNLMVGWPTKMTFAPLFAQKIQEKLESQFGIFPQKRLSSNIQNWQETLLQYSFCEPLIAEYPWEDQNKIWHVSESFL